MQRAQRFWLGGALAALLLLGVTGWLVLRTEQRAWRDVVEVWDAASDGYRDFYAHEVTLWKDLRAQGGNSPKLGPELARILEAERDRQLALERELAFEVVHGGVQHHPLGTRSTHTLELRLRRLPPKSGWQHSVRLLLETERIGLQTEQRARLIWVQYDQPYGPMVRTLEKIFAPAGIPLEVEWVDPWERVP